MQVPLHRLTFKKQNYTAIVFPGERIYILQTYYLQSFLNFVDSKLEEID
jgi:hypothetical protein